MRSTLVAVAVGLLAVPSTLAVPNRPGLKRRTSCSKSTSKYDCVNTFHGTYDNPGKTCNCPSTTTMTTTNTTATAPTTTTVPTMTAPTSTPSNHRKRDIPLTNAMCKPGFTACGFYGSKKGGFECLNVDSHLESCGGCASQGQGQDCTDIDWAEDVACISGACFVRSCAPGFEVSENGTACQRSVKGTNRQVLQGAMRGAEKFWGM